MSNQLIPQFQQYFNALGLAEEGLELYTYEAGTLVNKITYQTYSGTANTNPILMDSAGFPPAGIYGSGSYRLILKNSEGVTLKDLDNVVLTEGLQPDTSGNYVMGADLTIEGNLNIDTLGYVYQDGDATGQAHNAYLDGTTWRAKSTGACQRIEFESNGDKVEYTSASTTIDLVITWIETKRTDVNGNMAYNGATIPVVGTTIATLNSAYMAEFYPNGRVVQSTLSGSKITYTNQNCFINGAGTYTYIDTGAATQHVEISDGRKLEKTMVSGIAGADFTAWVTIKQTDADGKLHLPFAPVIDL